MAFKEHDNNIVTKEQDEVEKYLMRIIQRYFDIENNYSKESIEAIILEALTRFKQIIVSETGFMFSLNQMTGKISLDIQTFGGEQAFNKKTAFNKDFGNDIGTICEGNDERLSDNRTPLAHAHIKLDIKDLEEKIKSTNVLREKDGHAHDNIDILNMIRYTGTQAQIDLIIIEYVQKAIKEYIENLLAYQREAESIQTHALEKLSEYSIQLKQIIENGRSLATESLNWLQNVQDFTENKVSEYKKQIQGTLLRYVSQQQLLRISGAIKRGYSHITEGELEFNTGHMSMLPLQHQNVTRLNELREAATTLSEMANEKSRLELYFRYDKNGATYNIPLPMLVHIDNSDIVIQGTCSEDGDIVVTSIVTDLLPIYVTTSGFSQNMFLVSNENPIGDYRTTVNYLKEIGCILAKIDTQDKNDFVSRMTYTDAKYFINGMRSLDKTEFHFENNDDTYELMTFFNWEDGYPKDDDNLDMICMINEKWRNVSRTEELGFIAEYEAKRLSQYFDNPRIYYRVLGNKEAM